MLPPEQDLASPSFDVILESNSLPQPGPDFYAARRALWLTPRSSPRSTRSEPSISRQRLENLLSPQNAAEDESVWETGVKRVWKSLDAGERLKKPLPLPLIIKILHAAWLHDETWPVGAAAPDSDDAQPGNNLARPLQPVPPSPWSSSATTPWMTAQSGDTEV